MVQDMYNPEFYLEKFEVTNEITKTTSVQNGKYIDVTDLQVWILLPITKVYFY